MGVIRLGEMDHRAQWPGLRPWQPPGLGLQLKSTCLLASREALLAREKAPSREGRVDSDRQVWEPGLDRGSTQALHSECHGPQEPEDRLANVAFTSKRSSHSCPGWGERGLVELRAAALGLLGFCCKPHPPWCPTRTHGACWT